jgi:hypothetical protein
MCFERRLTHFSLYLFGFADFSRKRPFLRANRAIPRLPLILIFCTLSQMPYERR